jgi:hypothetical protein
VAVICQRCGTPNPDQNQFCQACGTPLGAAAAAGPTAPPAPPPPGAIPGPPPGAPPPPAPWSGPPGAPPGIPAQHPYQNPYYAPSEVGPQPTVHRTPWILIAGAVIALIVVMAGCGAAFALLGNQAAKQSSTGIAPSPSPLPSPSPTGSPNPSASPTASPTPSPTPIQTTGGTVSNAGETVPVPSGWVVVTKDDQSITMTNPNGDGSITIGSGASVPAQTAQQNKDTVVGVFTSRYPDTKSCPGSQTTTGALDGAQGIFWQLCFTLTSRGQSLPAGAPMFAGANADGSVYYVVILVTSQSNMDSFSTEAKPILTAIQWKLK